MPEALVVLGLVVVTLIAWMGAWLHARNPANSNRRVEQERLRFHAAWLRDRIELARREKWDRSMLTGLTEELAATTAQLSQRDALAAPPAARDIV